MRIGIFGGSFDPVHAGHGMVANELSQSGLFDEVWLVPGRINPFKVGREPVSSEHRINMARIVARKCAAVRVSDIETRLPEPSYSINTLRELVRLYPGHSFRLIIGSDNWAGFMNWREAEAIIRDFGVIIYERPGYMVPDSLPDNVSVVRNMPQMQVSSSYIRDAIAAGRNVNFIVPDGVMDYIGVHGLYTDNSNNNGK